MPDKPYTIVKNDTLSKISQRFLGNPARYMEIFLYNRGKLRSGNPDLIFPGEKILIPLDDFEEKKEKLLVPQEIEDNQIVIEIDNKQFYNFQSNGINRIINSPADSFNINSFITDDEPSDEIKPFGYQKCKVAIGSDVIITGRIDVIDTDFSDSGLNIQLAGRSLAGQVVDVSIIKRPYEFNNLNLEEIAKSILNSFGISVLFPDGPGDNFTKITARHGETIFSFLNKLANMRSLLLSSDNLGRLTFKRASSGEPVAELEQGKAPLLSVRANYNGQERFSEIIIDSQGREGEGNIQAKITDSIVQEANINRPLVTRPTDTPEGLSLDDVVKWERGKRDASSMPVTAVVKGWRKPDGGVWKDDEIITLLCPKCYIKKPTDYLITAVNLNQSESQRTATLTLSLPSAYSLKDEQERPWQK